MDHELKVYLDGMRDSLINYMGNQIEDTRRELKQVIGVTKRELMQHTYEQVSQTKQELMQYTDSGLNKAQVLIESLHQDIRGVADGVLQVEAKLDRICADHERRITNLENRTR